MLIYVKSPIELSLDNKKVTQLIREFMKTPCDRRKVSMILHGQLATPSFILLSKVDADIYVKSLRKVRFGVQSYIPQLRKKINGLLSC